MTPRLWSVEDIAEFASYSKAQAWKIVSQPDFPKAIRVFNGAHPRWEAQEVIECARQKKEAA